MCVPIPLTDVMSLLLQIEHVIGHGCHSLIYVFTMLSAGLQPPLGEMCAGLSLHTV